MTFKVLEWHDQICVSEISREGYKLGAWLAYRKGPSKEMMTGEKAPVGGREHKGGRGDLAKYLKGGA